VGQGNLGENSGIERYRTARFADKKDKKTRTGEGDERDTSKTVYTWLGVTAVDPAARTVGRGKVKESAKTGTEKTETDRAATEKTGVLASR